MGWQFIIQTLVNIIVIFGAIWLFASKILAPYKDLLKETREHYQGLIGLLKEREALLQEKHADEMKELQSHLEREKAGAIEAKDTQKREMIERIEKQRDEYKQAYESEKGRRTELDLKHSTLVKIVAEYDKRYGRDMMSNVPTLAELLIHQPAKLTEMITSKDKGPFPLPPLKPRLIRRKKPPS